MEFPAKNSLSSKDFIKLKDGEFIEVIFRGTPFDFKQHWIGNKPSLCSQDGLCETCKKGTKPAFRFRIHAVIKENNNYIAKIWEQGWTVYESLIGINSDYPLEKTWLKLTRKGTDKNDTTYIVVPRPKNTSITDEQEKIFQSLKYPELNNFEASEVKENPPSLTDDDIPF